MSKEKQQVIILHGFDKEAVFTLVRAIKREAGAEADIAFAMTTPNSLTMKLGDVVQEVAADHAYMKANRPPHQKEPN
ncbi:MAG: DUF3783 domain-containing protein [Sphaerochaetaceae bacterium]|jgi:hypothetical protein